MKESIFCAMFPILSTNAPSIGRHTELCAPHWHNRGWTVWGNEHGYHGNTCTLYGSVFQLAHSSLMHTDILRNGHIITVIKILEHAYDFRLLALQIWSVFFGDSLFILMNRREILFSLTFISHASVQSMWHASNATNTDEFPPKFGFFPLLGRSRPF